MQLILNSKIIAIFLFLVCTGYGQIRQDQVRGLADSLAKKLSIDSLLTEVGEHKEAMQDTLGIGVNMPSDSTGLATGKLYFDATGILRRKY